MRRTILSICAIAVCVAGALAQNNPPKDTLKVDYFANANTTGAPDGTLRITNPGTAQNIGGSSGNNPTNICAYIAVFDPNQEMSECCGCLLTPDGLRTLSVDKDLTSNPLTGVTLQTGVIKIVSVSPTNNACPLPGQITGKPVVEAGIRAWATHIQNSNFSLTETPSQDATLSNAEETLLSNECSSIVLVGSGKGICSCGTGD